MKFFFKIFVQKYFRRAGAEKKKRKSYESYDVLQHLYSSNVALGLLCTHCELTIAYYNTNILVLYVSYGIATKILLMKSTTLSISTVEQVMTMV